MSHWQTGKLDLKCSLNILRRAIINLMPDWEEHINVDEKGTLKAKYDGSLDAGRTYQMVISGSGTNLYNDIGLSKNQDGTWDVGGGYTMNHFKDKLTGEVMRMRAVAIAKMRGYDIIRNENNDEEIVTDIRVDVDKAKELMV